LKSYLILGLAVSKADSFGIYIFKVKYYNVYVQILCNVCHVSVDNNVNIKTNIIEGFYHFLSGSVSFAFSRVTKEHQSIFRVQTNVVFVCILWLLKEKDFYQSTYLSTIKAAHLYIKIIQIFLLPSFSVYKQKRIMEM